jgi:hypothetical protein
MTQEVWDDVELGHAESLFRPTKKSMGYPYPDKPQSLGVSYLHR